jgi:hypothetical protein
MSHLQNKISLTVFHMAFSFVDQRRAFGVSGIDAVSTITLWIERNLSGGSCQTLEVAEDVEPLAALVSDDLEPQLDGKIHI